MNHLKPKVRSRGRHCLRVVSSIVSLLSSTALVFLYFLVKIEDFIIIIKPKIYIM